MRRLLLLAHRVPVSGNFTLNDLAGGAGRMDEVARCVSTAFTLSNDLRRDTEMTILFVAEPPPRARQIRLVGSRLKFLNPDERSTAALLKNALVRSLSLEREVEASPGLLVGPVDPEPALRAFLGQPDPIWLVEDGAPLTEWRPEAKEFAAVISDPTDLLEAEAAAVRAAGVPMVSVGPRSLRSSQCIDVLHNEFDRRQAALRPPDAERPPPSAKPP